MRSSSRVWIRDAKDHLPGRMRPTVERPMRDAHHAGSALDAEAQLTVLAREPDKTHPSAATSLREGMGETLTVLALGVPPTLARTLRSRNAIESMISTCRERSKNVKRRRDGQMAALVRGRDGGGQGPVPLRQRPPEPARTAGRPRPACRRADRRSRPP